MQIAHPQHFFGLHRMPESSPISAAPELREM
jgi:hypothetical protein